MSAPIQFIDLSKNLMAFIYQYLSGKEMALASSSCRKMREAFNQDFLFIELSKRDHLFLPSEGDKFNTWKEYFLYLKQLKTNISSGKPNIGYKMEPYRGHKAPIEAFAIFNHKKEMTTTIVSGDSNGELLTWNIEEDEDGDKIQKRDLILKADSGIAGIKNLNDDCNMIVWTDKNKFYYYNVNMFKKTDKNSERFELEKEFSIDENDNPIKQLYYDAASSTIFMSPNLRGVYQRKNIYSYDLKTYTLNKYKFDYNSIQTNAVLNNNQNNNNHHQGWNAFNNNNNLFGQPIHQPNLFGQPIHQPNNHNFDSIRNTFYEKERGSRQNYFIVTEDKLIAYINYEPIRNRPIAEYVNKMNLPNVFIFNKSTNLLINSYHIDLDNIYNILPIDNSQVAFIGVNINPTNNKSQVALKIYHTNYFVIYTEKILYDNFDFKRFDLVYYANNEVYYLINDKILKKVENIKAKQLKVDNIATLKEILNINCIEGDEFRIVIASDEECIGVFERTTGKLWFFLLSGSKIVYPKSFVKHPAYKGFHIIKVTRNAIVSAIGNLIREYKFTFKRK